MPKKQRIPPTIRKVVFNRWSKGRISMLCYCCRINEIDCHDFECGHIVAEGMGGRICEENLRPICTPCNRSMGTRNMFEYIEQFGFWKKNKEVINPKRKNSLKDIVVCILIINGNLPMHYRTIAKECENYQHIYGCQLNGKTPENTISRTLTTNMKSYFTRTESGTYQLRDDYINTLDYHEKIKKSLVFMQQF